MATWLRISLAILAAVVIGFASAFASVYSAVYLYQVNNPQRYSTFMAGFGFELYIPLVVGGLTGAILAFTAVLNDASSYIYVGATMTSLIFFVGVAFSSSSASPYDAIDWFCLPFILSIGLLAWGIIRQRLK